MGLYGRLSAIGGAAAERLFVKAEEAVGMRAMGLPAGYGGPPPHPFEEVPFFPPDTDWRQLAQELTKAAVPVGVEPLAEQPGREARALVADPLQMVELLGYKERPTGLAYGLIQMMVRRTPFVQAIILTRVAQAVRHCTLQDDRYSLGFCVRHRDKKTNLSRAARRRASEIELALLKTTTGDAGVGRDNFAKFTAKCLRDSLTYDQLNFEVIPTRRGKPHSWHAVDAKTIRLADTDERFLDAASDRKIRTVQVYDGMPIHQWPASELAFAIRNPDASIQAQGYGLSELEMAVNLVAWLLWAVQYNARFFSQGSTPKGVLNFKGQIPGRQLAAFRRFFYQMLAGVENAWRTPVLNAEQGVEWVSMHSNNRDMEYGQWVDLLLKILCAVYLMDPMEINFKYGNENDRSLFESANQQKVTQSKDKGLKPLMTFWGDTLNTWVVHRLDPDFEVRFLGLDALTPKEQAELDKIQGETYLMMDEVRERDGRSPLPDGRGQVVANSAWLQYIQAREAQEAAAAQMAAGPQDGSPEAPPGSDADLDSALSSVMGDGGFGGAGYSSMGGAAPSAAGTKRAVSRFEL